MHVDSSRQSYDFHSIGNTSNVLTHRIDFSSKDTAAMVTMLECFGYLVVLVAAPDAFEMIADASYLAACRQAARHPFVCTCPCAELFDAPENLYQSV